MLWKSKCQTITVLSSTEAEYVALTHAGMEARWFRNLLTELGFPMTDALTIRSDSLGAISRITNLYITTSSWHIDLKWHSVKQLVKLNIITPEDVRDADQTADVLTKLLPRPKHKKHTVKMGLATVWRGVLRDHGSGAPHPSETAGPMPRWQYDYIHGSIYCCM
jgi:hypothetical protein